MNPYLQDSIYINWKTPQILSKASALRGGLNNKALIAKACFNFVRDEIKHSWDYELNPVTCKATDVLEHGTGFCYAKSHLLAALLRANEIPAGLCYQRLTIAKDNPSYCLHGLNALFLETHGWYRVDARGNKTGIEAQFNPPIETLAFPILEAGERDFPEIWAEPLPIVVKSLASYKTYIDLANNLPDIQVIK